MDLRWAVKADLDSLHQNVGVLRTKKQGGKADIFPSLFTITDPPLLYKAGTEQVRQVLKASTAVQTYADSEWACK